jgi:sensor histidine kinase YesM
MVTGRNEDCYKYFVETKNIASYSGEYVKRLDDSYLRYNNVQYKNLKEKTSNGRIIITIFLGFATFFCIIFSAFFSRWVTVPIEELAVTAEEISRGNFDVKSMNPAGMYEIDMLQAGFTKMVWEIRILIEKIKEKATIEKRLDEQELKNLLVENMLKESQLKALQSQINPHFLFNTLNTIAQTAIIEEADETEGLINAVSELLRYSLSMIDRQSMVGAEISVINQYIFIQETRFKDRVKFNISVDKSLNNVQVPGMILQPLVENAFIHGIEGREEGGEINISVYKEDDFCILMVEDNGGGISSDKLNEIISEEGAYTKGSSTGIGVKNVIRRLKIMFSNDDVIRIESELNKGTRIYIKIPINRGE